MVIKPTRLYHLGKDSQQTLDRMFKETGALQCLLSALLFKSFLTEEADHVEAP